MKKLSIAEPPLKLYGFPWFARNGGNFYRLPPQAEPRVSLELWEMAKQTSGGRIRFRTNSTSVGMRVRWAEGSAIGNPSSRIARAGFDLYADGVYWSSVYPHKDGLQETMFFDEASAGLREIEIYFPLNTAVDVEAVLLDDDAEIAASQPYRNEGYPIVYYGTSITQGLHASRASGSYPARLSRLLGMDYVNLGFSGLGKGEVAVAEAMGGLDAAAYVLDYGQNHESAKTLAAAYGKFLDTLLAMRRPGTPILLTTPIPYTGEGWVQDFRAEQEAKRDVVRRAIRERVQAGIESLYLLEGTDLLDVAGGEGQMDGAHPNDIGFHAMCRAMAPVLEEMLTWRAAEEGCGGVDRR